MEPMKSNVPAVTTGKKPENGIRGLKHWRYDLLAGMQVSLVSLPLSLGIAIASGAPPVTGIVSAVIAGLIYPFIGGAYVTISGPAAGCITRERWVPRSSPIHTTSTPVRTQAPSAAREGL